MGDRLRADIPSRSAAVPRWGRWGHRPLQVVARLPNLAVRLIHCGQFILGKISKFDANKCQILRLKCTKFDFRLLGELTALPQTL